MLRNVLITRKCRFRENYPSNSIQEIEKCESLEVPALLNLALVKPLGASENQIF